MSIAENIKALRAIFHVTQRELAEIAGVTENAVSKWENGYSEPRMGAIERMASCYGITKSNIIEEGGMTLIDPVTKKPRIKQVPGAITPPEPRKAYLPLLGKVHAGDAQEPQVLDERISLPYEVWEHHRDGYFLQVEGQCMSKIYPEGSYILIDPMQRPTNGSIAVVSIDGADYVMRRLYRGANVLVLSPDSFDDGYTDIVVDDPAAHTVEFVGTVVWFQPSAELE